VRQNVTTPTTNLLTAAGAALLLVLCPASGCGQTSPGIQGVSCAADGDCNPGLRCLPYQVFADGGGAACASLGRQCLKACHVDTDCAQGPGLVCLTACGGTPACEDPSTLGAPPEAGAGPDAAPEAAGD
jgi:hypothetical protein